MLRLWIVLKYHDLLAMYHQFMFDLFGLEVDMDAYVKHSLSSLECFDMFTSAKVKNER